jgi:uncharacterized protein (DUF2252 family)
MGALHNPVPEKQISRTVADRRAAGRSLRKEVPRYSHEEWSPAPDRPDPISLLEEQNLSRQVQLLPIRYSRMAASPFGFLRGAAVVMAQDLAATPVTGLQVQVCGDAHLSNFGVYATAERNQVFDVNDFDETLPGPWEWDIKRLSASVIVAGRTNGFSTGTNRQAVLQCVKEYRERMWEYADMSYLDVWYARLDPTGVRRFVGRADRSFIDKELRQSRHHSDLAVFPRLTQERDGRYRIKVDPPLITRLDDDELEQRLSTLLAGYSDSLQEDRRLLLSKYRFIDIVQKVVGVGSVGTRCYIALLLGNESSDPLFLQVKEAQASVLERHLGLSTYSSHARRVVSGQRIMQAASDLFLGWTAANPFNFYVRQLRDMKLSVDISRLNSRRFIEYCRLCGWTLARAHARSGDPAEISGYLGRGNTFEQAIAAFAETYADQTMQDHAALVAAIREGRISVKETDQQKSHSNSF